MVRKAGFHHLARAADLVTPYENIRAGFVRLALEKGRRASPYVAQARDLAERLRTAPSAEALVGRDDVRGALLAAAGLSDKAAGHVDTRTGDEAIARFVETYLAPAGASFREEAVYRFLLTRGDALGGSMRNVVGQLALARFAESLLARLANAGIAYEWYDGKQWRSSLPNEPAAIRRIAWRGKEQRGRLLAVNAAIAIVGKNVDIAVLAVDRKDGEPRGLPSRPNDYLALGELKGGIDPAGADEHWKTGRTSLERIREAFSRHGLAPALFFVGAAIESAMADEIWKMLKEGRLKNAANLTVDAHMASLCDWLIHL